MKKILKISLILTLILGFCTTYVLATDINITIPGSNTDQTNTNQSDNTVNDQNSATSDENNNADVFNDLDASSNQDETLNPNVVDSNSSSGLSVTNIINILLIAVGVILILLAIAIIIRLK